MRFLHSYKMLKSLVLIVSVICGGSISQENDYSNDYDPIEEIQHAACKIATKEIQATANATITRQLKGVCTSKELASKLDKMESNLLREIENLKTTLGGGYSKEATGKSKRNAKLKSAKVKDLEKNTALKGREAEIIKYNATSNFNGREKEFNYYWRIANASNIFKLDELISENFFASGKIYYIKLTPNYLQTKYTSIELKSANLIKKFHRFVVLNQDDAKFDVSSQPLSNQLNHASMFKISGDKLRSFAKNDTLLIKIILYI